MNYTKVIQLSMLIGISLGTACATLPGSGFINTTVADTSKPDYKLIAAIMYTENNMPSPHDPMYTKAARACELVIEQPQLCGSTFFCCQALQTSVEQLRAYYCDKDASQLFLGKLPVKDRPDAPAIMQAFDHHTTDVLGAYHAYGYPTLEPEGTGLELFKGGFIGYIYSGFMCCFPSTISGMAVPCCALSTAACCLSRCLVMVDQL